MNEPNIVIMKITDGKPWMSNKYFYDLFVQKGCISQIGYTKDDGKIEDFKQRWNNIQIGDLIVVLEGSKKVHGVVEVTSEPWDEERNIGNDWFFHRREVNLIKYFEHPINAKSSTNRDTIIEYSGNGAIGICDEIWDMIKVDYFNIKKEQGMQKYIDLLKANKNLILTGAPGTGKTYLAKEIADKVISDKKAETPIDILATAIKNFKPNEEERKERKGILEAFLNIFPESKIPSLILDEYCAGKGGGDNFCWWIETGLKKLGSFAPAQRGAYVYGIFFNKDGNEYKKRDTLNNDDDETALMKILKLIDSVLTVKNEPQKFEKAIDEANKLNYFDNGFLMKIITSYGVNGFIPIHSLRHLQNCAKLFHFDIRPTERHNIYVLNQELFKLYRQLSVDGDITPFEFMRLLYSNFNVKEGEIIAQNNEIKLSGEQSFVQFHPSYDYTDFVEGLRPIKKEGEKELGFELKNGIFKEFCKKAKENPNKNYVFIIDEINRAEVSKVFGELFYSIDPGYRGEKGKVKTQYNNIQTEETFFTDIADDYFYVPENVYIIGTMNDIDRSVESFDFAMRRRFAWVEVKADDRISMWDGEIDVWQAEAKLKMQAINKIIENTEGLKSSSYHIGPSYFLKLKDYNGDVKQLWDYHIGVILNEYLRGMPDAKTIFDELKTAYDGAK